MDKDPAASASRQRLDKDPAASASRDEKRGPSTAAVLARPATMYDPLKSSGTMHGHAREYCQWAVGHICHQILPWAEGLQLEQNFEKYFFSAERP